MAGMIAVPCAECGTTLRVHEADWAEGIPCPGCGAEIRQPSKEELVARQVDELQTQLGGLDEQVVELQQQNNQLRAKLTEQTQNAKRFEERGRQLQAELDNAANPSQGTDQSQRVAMLQQRYDQINEEIRLTKEKAKAQIDQLTERANQAVRDRIDQAAQQMHQTYNVSRQDLVGELDKVNQDADLLRGDLARREQEVQQQEREHEELQSKLAELQSYLQVANDATQAAEARAAELTPQAAGLDEGGSKEELERLRTTNKRQLKQLPTLQDHHARLEDYLKDLNDRLASISPQQPTPLNAEPNGDMEPVNATDTKTATEAPAEEPPRERPSTVRLMPLKKADEETTDSDELRPLTDEPAEPRPKPPTVRLKPIKRD